MRWSIIILGLCIGPVSADNELPMARRIEIAESLNEAVAKMRCCHGTVEIEDFSVVASGDRVAEENATLEFQQDGTASALSLTSTSGGRVEKIGGFVNPLYSADFEMDQQDNYTLKNVISAKSLENVRSRHGAEVHFRLAAQAGLYTVIDLGILLRDAGVKVAVPGTANEANPKEFTLAFKSERPVDSRNVVRSGTFRLANIGFWVCAGATLNWQGKAVDDVAVLESSADFSVIDGILYPVSSEEVRRLVVKDPSPTTVIECWRKCRYRIVVSDSIPGSTFYLSSIGLPEPDFSVPRRLPVIPLLSIGVFLILIVLLIRHQAKPENGVPQKNTAE